MVQKTIGNKCPGQAGDTMIQVKSILLTALLLLFLFGCDSSDNEEVSLPGSYTATRVNGQELPAVYYAPSGSDCEFRLDESTLLLREDMTYRWFYTNSQWCMNMFRNADSDDSDGDYTASGNTIHFFPRSSSSNNFSGSIRGKTIEVTRFANEEAYTITFEKQ